MEPLEPPTLEELTDRFISETKEYTDKDEIYRALDSTHRSIDLHGESGRLLNARGMAFRGLGDIDKALADFSKAIRIDPSPWVYYCNRATTLISVDRTFDAVQDLGMAIKLQPSVPQCRYLRAKIQMQQEHYKEAAADFGAGIPNDGSPFRAYFGRGRCFQCLGILPKAIADYQTAKGLPGIEAGSYNDLGMVFYELGLGEEARFCFKKALHDQMNVSAYHNNLGLANVQLKQYRDAAVNFETAQTLDEKNPQIFINRGNMWLAQNNPSKAIIDMEVAVSLGSLRPECLFALGLAHQQAGGPDNLVTALEQFNKILCLNDDDAAARFHAALVNGKLGEYETALALLNRCVREAPTDTLVTETRGLVHQGMENHVAAVSDFSAIIAQAPHVGEYYYYRGESRRRLGLLDDAEKDLNTAIELEFRDPCVFSSRAMVKHAQGKHSRAVLDAMVALELSASAPDTEILLNASVCFQHMHDYRRAEVLVTDALNLATGKGDVRLWLQRGIVRREAGQLDCACEDLERTLETADARKDAKLKLKAWTNLAYCCAGLDRLTAASFYIGKAIDAICFERPGSHLGEHGGERDVFEGKHDDFHAANAYDDADSFAGVQGSTRSVFPTATATGLEEISHAVRRLLACRDLQKARVLLGLVMERAKTRQRESRHRDAVEDLDMVIQHAPACANAFFYRAFSFKALKDLDSAAADFEHAKELEPSNPQLVVSYRKIYGITIKHLCAPGEEEIRFPAAPKLARR